MSNEYSSKKAAYHFGSLAILAAGQQPNPVHVLCVLSDLCSHDCTFCLFRASGYETSKEFGIINKSGIAIKNPNRMIPFAKAIEIVRAGRSAQIPGRNPIDRRGLSDEFY